MLAAILITGPLAYILFVEEMGLPFLEGLGLWCIIIGLTYWFEKYW